MIKVGFQKLVSNVKRGIAAGAVVVSSHHSLPSAVKSPTMQSGGCFQFAHVAVHDAPQSLKPTTKVLSFVDLRNKNPNIGKTHINGSQFDIVSSGDTYLSLRNGPSSEGFVIFDRKVIDGKPCYSCGELRNLSDHRGAQPKKTGIGTRLMQLAFKAHKDVGNSGEFRVHDVLTEAEEFYERLGFVQDMKREGQWFLPKKNEHILENGGKIGKLEIFA